MPSFYRASTMPVVIEQPSSPKKGRVSFDGVTGISRPLTSDEGWSLVDFENHAEKCKYCHDPYSVHRSGARLCDDGHALAQQVAKYLYKSKDGNVYSQRDRDQHQLVRVEIPVGFVEIRSLLRAIERSVRHRGEPIVSFDRTYYVAPRESSSSQKHQHSSPKASKSYAVKEPQTERKRERRHSTYEPVIVEWPSERREPETRVEVEVLPASSKRGSLYIQDLADRRKALQSYRAELREPDYKSTKHRR